MMTQAMKSESLEALYYIAYHRYRQGKYADAESLFRVLTTLGRRNFNYWMGLAGAYQVQKKYREAIEAYREAFKLTENDPKVSFHTAECYFALGEKEAGLHALECAERHIRAQRKPDENMLAHIALVREAWINKTSK